MRRNVALSERITCRVGGKRYQEAALYIATVVAYAEVFGPDEGLTVEHDPDAFDQDTRELLR